MKNLQEDILKIIYSSIERINEERESNDQILLSLDTSLFGEEAVLDSLTLVSLIVDLETAISDQFKITINLTDEKAMERSPVPFTNISNLSNYIKELLSECDI